MKGRAFSLLIFAVFVLALAPSGLAASVSWTGGGDGQNWSDARNWSSGSLPGANDDVAIPATANNPTIQITSAAGNVQIHSLNSALAVSISNGLLTLASPSVISGQLSVYGASSSLNANSQTTALANNILVGGGAQVSFPNVTSYTVPAGVSVTWETQSNGTVLSFPNLTTITGNATAGTYFSLVAHYGSSLLSLPALTTITKPDDGDPYANSGVALVVYDGATISAPNLVTFQDNDSHPNSSFYVSGDPGKILIPKLLAPRGVASINLGSQSHPEQFTSLVGTNSLVINSGTVTITSLTSLGGINLIASNGAQVSFPNVTSYTVPAGVSVTWETQSNGTVLSFPNLTTITGNATAGTYFSLVAHYGSSLLSLPALTTITKPDDGDPYANSGVALVVYDGATISAPNLVTFQDNDSHPNSSFYVSGDPGKILIPKLLAPRGVASINLGSQSHPEQFTSLVGTSSFQVNTGTVVMSNLTSIAGLISILANSGAQVSFPNVTSYTGLAGTTVTWQASSGGVLSFPNLTTITGNATPGAYLNLVTQYGTPTLSLPALTTITKADDGDQYNDSGVGFYAYDGTISAPNLVTFQDNDSHPNSSITASNRGVISFPRLAILVGVSSNVDFGGDLQAPDLRIVNLSLGQSDLHSGALVTLQWVEQNTGATAAVGAYYDAIHVSNATTGETVLDAVFNPNEGSSTNTLAAGGSKNHQYSVRLPDGPRSVGNLVFTVTIDCTKAIYEGGPVSKAETNNATSTTAAFALAAYPDLAVTNVATPATNAVIGQQITLNWTVKNNGPGRTNGFWVDQVFLSNDTQVGNDQYLGSFSFSDTLASGASVVRNGVVSLPTSGLGGKYLVVVTNAGQDIYEVERTNNGFVAARQIQISGYGVSLNATPTTFIGGASISLSGTTYDPSTGASVGNAPVSVIITHGGTVRTLATVSDASGHYQVAFQPLPQEGGDYSVNAGLPSMPSPTPQAQFSLLAMSATPAAATQSLLPGTAYNGQFTLTNLGSRPLSNIRSTVTGTTPNITLQVSPPGALAAGASATVAYTVIASDDSTPTDPGAQIRLTSAEGATAVVSLNLSVATLAPRLVTTPTRLDAGMLRGGQRVVQFNVVNQGATATGPLTVKVSAASWLALASSAQVSSLASGERTTVTLTLTPAGTLPLGPYTGSVAISGAAASLSVPFQFTCTSNLMGDVHVQAVDEYTFFANGAPKVAGATVTLTDPTGNVVKTGTTGANGEVLLSGLTEGYYQLEARANDHNTSRSNILVTASQVTEVSAFLARELISYIWTVTPTEIEDHYIFTLDVKFATDVPAPVVTIEPASIDLSTLTDDTTQVNFTVTNHGLIAADHVNLSFEDDPVWKITPLAGNVGTLAAKQSVTIPVAFQHLRSLARSVANASHGPRLAGSPQGKCQIDGKVDSDFQCGGTAQKRSTPVKTYNGNGDCGPLGPTDPLTHPLTPSDVTGPSTSIAGQCKKPFALKSQTVATIPTDRERLKIGVGEEVVITVEPASAGPVTWLPPSAGGTLEGKTATSAKFIVGANATPAAVIGARNSAGDLVTLTFNIVEPEFETAAKTLEYTYPAGQQGAGMRLGIFVHPTDVSFDNVECREESGPASNITGFFLLIPSANQTHDTDPSWIGLNNENAWQDDAKLSGVPKIGLYWGGGEFDWIIPVKWRVVGETNNGRGLPARIQRNIITDSFGTTTVIKSFRGESGALIDASVTRSP